MNNYILSISIFAIFFSLVYTDCVYPNNAKDVPIMGAETIIRLTPYVFLITSSNRIQTVTNPNGPFEFNQENPKTQGGLFVYYRTQNSVEEIDIRDWPLNKNFQPFGMYHDEQQNLLYTINDQYSNVGTTVEEFHINIQNIYNIKITYKQTLINPVNLTGAFNSLIKIAPGKIIATVFSLAMPKNGNFEEVQAVNDLNFEAYNTKTNIGNLQLCTWDINNEQSEQELICEKIPGTDNPLNNGINWDRNKIVIVGNTVNTSVTIYELQDKTPILKELDQLIVQGASDNIDYNTYTNQFTVAGVTNPLPLIKFLGMTLEEKKQYIYENDNKQVLSFVTTITQEGTAFKRELIYFQKNPLAGVSHGLTLDNEGSVLIGSWLDKSIVLCSQNKNQMEQTEN